MTRELVRLKLEPMTAERKAKMLAALDDADRFRAELLRQRRGKLFVPVSEDLAAIRAEQEEEHS